jgi:magnesium transporter
MPVSRTLLYGPQGRFDESVHPDQISELIPDSANVLWLDIEDPTEGDITLLRQEFGFHELALEDVVRRHQRAKIEQYDTFAFLVFYAVRELGIQEINLFVGPNYLVTVHYGGCAEISETAERWRKNAGRIEHGVGSLVYSLLDAVVDGYFPLLDQIAEKFEDLEQDIFQTRRDCLQQVFEMKKELLELRRVLGPERDVLNVLIRRDSPYFGGSSHVYFQDVYDHIIRVLDSIDLYREQLSSVLDVYLTISSNRLGFVVKRMTALSTILMSLALIASIYGMNFELTPSGENPFGFEFALTLMAFLGTGLALMFRKIDWL